jgi:hypothetical protein
MQRKVYTPEQTINKLREAEVLLSQADIILGFTSGPDYNLGQILACYSWATVWYFGMIP